MSTYLYCGFSLNSQSVANNTSSVTFWVDIQMTGNSWNELGMSSSRSFGGNISGSASWTSTCGKNQRKRIRTETITVRHNADGTAWISGSATVKTDISAGTIRASTSMTLPTIARASQPSCITYPNTTQNIGNMGSTIAIHMNRASSSFTHTVKYQFGNASGTIAIGVTNNCKWTIPTSLANQIPNGTSGTGTITVTTYNGRTNIGTKSVSFTTTVPSSVVPTMSSCAVTVDNSANDVVKGWGLYVAGYSKARITASASGVSGSIIKSFTINGGYSTTQNVSTASLDYTGEVLTAGNKTFDVFATDSRGRKSALQRTETVTVYAYSPPSVMEFTVERDDDVSTKIKVLANWTFASVNGKNTSTGTLTYKKGESTGWTTYGEIAKGQLVTLDGDFDEASSYDFRITVQDALSNSSQKDVHISTRQVLLDFGPGGKALGIGKIVERTEGVECSLPFDFLDAIYINGVTLDQYIRTIVNSVINGQSLNEESVINNEQSGAD